MPLVYQQNINEHTQLGVWQIDEDESFFLNSVSLQSTITHPHKRLQHLAGRLLLKVLFPDFPLELVQIADTRKPFLPGDPFHFSISHCENYAAAIVSRSNRVGVDIEVAQEKIGRIGHKFLTAAEAALLSSSQLGDLQSLTLAWSIKEALFKWYANGQVDFKQHLHIDNLTLDGEKFTAACRFTKAKIIPVDAQGILFARNCLCWICT